jgi:hypothetical protein
MADAIEWLKLGPNVRLRIRVRVRFKGKQGKKKKIQNLKQKKVVNQNLKAMNQNWRCGEPKFEEW